MDRKPFPLLGGLGAAVASYGLFQDVPVVPWVLAGLFALLGVVGFIVYQRRKVTP